MQNHSLHRRSDPFGLTKPAIFMTAAVQNAIFNFPANKTGTMIAYLTGLFTYKSPALVYVESEWGRL